MIFFWLLQCLAFGIVWLLKVLGRIYSTFAKRFQKFIFVILNITFFTPMTSNIGKMIIAET